MKCDEESETDIENDEYYAFYIYLHPQFFGLHNANVYIKIL